MITRAHRASKKHTNGPINLHHMIRSHEAQQRIKAIDFGQHIEPTKFAIGSCPKISNDYTRARTYKGTGFEAQFCLSTFSDDQPLTAMRDHTTTQSLKKCPHSTDLNSVKPSLPSRHIVTLPSSTWTTKHICDCSCPVTMSPTLKKLRASTSMESHDRF